MNIEDMNIEDIKTRFKPYINIEFLEIEITKQTDCYKIIIKINIESILRKELSELSTPPEQIENIFNNKQLIQPLLEGYIYPSESYAKINFLKVGLFVSTCSTFNKEEKVFIDLLLAGKGIGSLLVLIFIYLCFQVRHKTNIPIDKVSLRILWLLTSQTYKLPLISIVIP